MSISIGLSLIAFPTAHDFHDFLNRDLPGKRIDPVYELSYKMDEKYLQAVSRLPVRIVSAHAPCPHTEVLPNLGSGDSRVIDESLSIIRRSAETAARFGADVLVLHAGYTTDKSVHTLFSRRRELLEAESRDSEYILRKDGMICSPAYCESDVYHRHLLQAVRNLPRAVEVCRTAGVTLAVENINPRITYLFQRPEDLLYLADSIPGIRFCLDFGHLWLSSIVHHFDFLDAVERLIGTGRVITTHMHNNCSSRDDFSTLADDHRAIPHGNIPYLRIMELLCAGGVDRLIIEAEEPPAESLHYLAQHCPSLS